MTLNTTTLITVAGAGSVGCYVGAWLADAGRNVTLLLRPALAEAIAVHGVRVSDLEGRDMALPSHALKFGSDPEAALGDAQIVLVTAKSRDTETMAGLIKQHAPRDAVIVSLQNGVENAAVLRRVLGPNARVVAAMIPFNVVHTVESSNAPRFHRASSGTMQLERGEPGLRDLLDVPGAAFAEHNDIDAALWGKLLVNLNNALNALSGLPLPQQLGDRRWRLLISRQLREGLAVLRAAGIRPASVEGVPPRLMAFALRFPNTLFRVAAKSMLSVDMNARSSMWQDLQAGRPTEIDYLQGEIIKLAEKYGIEAPVNRHALELIKDAERGKKTSFPGLSPETIGAAR